MNILYWFGWFKSLNSKGLLIKHCFLLFFLINFDAFLNCMHFCSVSLLGVLNMRYLTLLFVSQELFGNLSFYWFV
jgi:hypothetical protein